MDHSTLEAKWDSIIYNGRSTFEFKRIDSICIPELNIGFNSLLNRCLILELPKENKVEFRSTVKQNLSIEFFRDTNYIVIQLTDSDFYDLFNDLIISLYHRIKSISSVKEYSKELIQTFHKWSEFFEAKQSDLLSENDIKGLIGELLVLRFLIKESKASQINNVLDSWKGPYDKGNDFEFDTKNIEVKTKNSSAIYVKIASEFQLDKMPYKGLDLIVVSLESDFIYGITIHELILEIKNQVLEYLGDISILLKALQQKNINMKNAKQYDIYRFKPVEWTTYDTTVTGFPKLTKSNIPTELSGITFNLRVSSLDTFKVEQRYL